MMGRVEAGGGRRSRPVCRHCGLPVKAARAEPIYCCSGCAWADRLSGGEGGAAAGSAPLVAAGTAAVFGLVNQLLGWCLAVMLAREGAVRGAELAALGAQLAGVVAVCALGVAQFRVGARSLWDGLWLAAAASLQVAAGFDAVAIGCGVAVNFALALWAARGLARTRAKNAGGH